MVTVLPPAPPYPSTFRRAEPPLTSRLVVVVTDAPSRNSSPPLPAISARSVSALLLLVAPTSANALAPSIYRYDPLLPPSPIWPMPPEPY